MIWREKPGLENANSIKKVQEMNHWRIIHPQANIPDCTGTPFDEALHVEKHLDKTKFQAFENETDKLAAVDRSITAS